MRLTIKAIIRWEQLRDKPFARFSYSDEKDINAILYVCDIDSVQNQTFDAFISELSAAKSKELAFVFHRESLIMSQFQKNREKESTKDESKSIEPSFIKDIVPLLIMSGLDANYALNEMALCDLPIFIHAYEQRQRDTMEQSRLWTFFNVSPYLSKDMTPKDFYPFPWEDHNKITSRDITQDEMEIFKSIKTSGLN